jgi:hypothetical protein
LDPPLFRAPEALEIEKAKRDGLSSSSDVPYQFYLGSNTESFGFIERNHASDSFGEDLGSSLLRLGPFASLW